MARSKRKRKARRSAVGSVPGTLTVDPEAPSPVVRMIAYGPEELEEETITDLSRLKDSLGKMPVTWVNVDGLGDAATIARIGEIFDLHPLALEDVVNVHQRAKAELYHEQVFIVNRMVSLNEQLDTEQLSIFLGRNFVLTFQERQGDCLDPISERIRKGMGQIRKAAAEYLAYALIDAVIDASFPVLEQYGERLELLENRVVTRPDNETIAQIYSAKRDLLALRRATWPLREAINVLLREQVDMITDSTKLYLRDCYDHVIQIIDMVETYREMVSGLLDAYQSSISNQMNAVMKVLTIIATIFIPLGFLAGIWGMNFNTEKSPVNMPELNWRWGYPFALALMATIAISMLAFFRKQGWLGRSETKAKVS